MEAEEHLTTRTSSFLLLSRFNFPTNGGGGRSEIGRQKNRRTQAPIFIFHIGPIHPKAERSVDRMLGKRWEMINPSVDDYLRLW